MRLQSLSAGDAVKTAVIGLITAAVTAAMMLMAIKSGVSPLPKPLALAFAQTILGKGVPLPIGLLFHAAWVTAFAFVYVLLFRDCLTFARAFWLAFLLWTGVLVVFFPLVGWGFLGLGIGPRMIVASAVPHLVFALLTWGLSRLLLSSRPRSEPSTAGAA
jgi:hypothetical protein